MAEVTVRSLIEDINATRTQASASAKDEIKVMRAMLNDPTYKVDVYGKSGVEGQYCPYDEARAMISSILKDTTRMSTKESEELAGRTLRVWQTGVFHHGRAFQRICQYLSGNR